MDYRYILRRAWQITLKNRILWVFGFGLALFGGVNNGGGFNNVNFLSGFTPPTMDGEIVFFVISLFLLLLTAWGLLGIIARPMFIAAIIGMGQLVEENSEVSFKQGVELSFSKQAFNVFLVNLLVRIPVTIIYLATFCGAFSPLLLLFFDNSPVQLLAVVTTGGILLMWVGFSTIFGFLVTPFIELSWRYAVLYNINALRSIRYCYALLRRKMKDFILAVLLMFAINLIWQIFNFFWAGLVVVVLVFMVSLPTMTADSIPATLAWGGAGVVGVIFLSPLLLLAGIFFVFYFTCWTLIFKDLNLTYF